MPDAQLAADAQPRTADAKELKRADERAFYATRAKRVRLRFHQCAWIPTAACAAALVSLELGVAALVQFVALVAVGDFMDEHERLAGGAMVAIVASALRRMGWVAFLAAEVAAPPPPPPYAASSSSSGAGGAQYDDYLDSLTGGGGGGLKTDDGGAKAQSWHQWIHEEEQELYRIGTKNKVTAREFWLLSSFFAFSTVFLVSILCCSARVLMDDDMLEDSSGSDSESDGEEGAEDGRNWRSMMAKEMRAGQRMPADLVGGGSSELSRRRLAGEKTLGEHLGIGHGMGAAAAEQVCCPLCYAPPCRLPLTCCTAQGRGYTQPKSYLM